MSYLDRVAAELPDNDSEYEDSKFTGCNDFGSVLLPAVTGYEDSGTVQEDEQEWERLREEEYQRIVNSPIRKPGLAITPKQKEIIVEALDQWSQDNPPCLFSPTQSTGVIRTYFPEKGYGFIRPDCGGLDVWFHARERADYDYDPQEGDRVIYLTRLGEKDSLVAKEFRLSDQIPIVSTVAESNMSGFNQPICQEIQSLSAEVNSKYDAGSSEREQQKQKMYDVIYGKRS